MKTTEKYKQELLEKSPNIIVIEEYQGRHTKILHKCLKCDDIFEAYPNNILRGHGCKKCLYSDYSKKRVKTHEQFQDEVADKIILLSEYLGATKPIDCLCVKCNYVWHVKNAGGLLNTGCPKCNNHITLTHNEFMEKVSNKLNENTEIIGRYTNTKTAIKCRCKICFYEWDTLPERLLLGCGCKRCADKEHGKKLKKTHEEYVSQVFEINENVIILEEYKGIKDKIKTKCKICNNIWTPQASSLLQGIGCPNCSFSKGEKNIINYLTNNNISFIPQKTFDDLLGISNGLLSYDFYLPQYNLLVEFQGEQHERPVEHFGGQKQFETQQEHDKRKREYAEKNNINLLEIWYYDIDNIESILLQKINEIKENNLKLGSVETVIPA